MFPIEEYLITFLICFSFHSLLHQTNISELATLNNNNNAHTINQNQINSMLIKDNKTKSTSSSTSSSEPMDQGDQPDSDYIKMFVGQVPRSMDEEQLREMFEEFGRVHTINVLRDKSNGLSKGKHSDKSQLQFN